MNILTMQNVSYKYEGTKKTVLKGINAEFETGKLYVIMGRSGAGKSTLLSLLSGLDTATEGCIQFAGADLSNADRDKYRARDVGVVFQGYNLLLNATALENILLSLHISGSAEKNKKAFALKLLADIGIDEETAKRKVLKLSGGEQQRVGIARALAHDPTVIIADEPTGNLDGDNETSIMSIFSKLAHERNKCVIIVTHSRQVAKYADELYGLNGGRLVLVKQTADSGKLL